MSPEQKQIKQLTEQLDSLTRLVNSLMVANEAPPEYVRSLGILTITPQASTKTTASETQAVDEAGSSTYSVAKPMDGFKNIGGFLVPYYNA